MANVFDNLDDANGNARLLSKSDIKTRLMKLAPRAFQTLEENLMCGDAKVEVAAALGILDRCGFGPQSKLTVSDEREDLSELSTVEIAARAAQLAKALLEQDGAVSEHRKPFDVH